MSKLIVGCGYVGRRLATAWHEQGEVVYVTTRSSERADEFAGFGWRPVLWDITSDSANQDKLPQVETVVFAVGFDRQAAKLSGQTIHDVYVGGLNRVLNACPSAGRWIYLSSTGVYGQSDGAWVDEVSPCEPQREGGKACLAAENLLTSHPLHGKSSVVLRLAGIYGPDRLPQAAKLKRGEVLGVASAAYLNLIHVDDIVQIIGSLDQITPPMRLCISDGHPVIRGEFYTYLSELLGCPAPKFEAPPTGSTRAERARGSKRIRNRQMMEILSPTLLYPSYREGLQAIVDDESP